MVFMPTHAPLMKIQFCKSFQATVIIKGNTLNESRKVATKYAKRAGMTYINGFDHPHILAGQGTIALEIVEQVKDFDAVIVPVGGAGLLAGTQHTWAYYELLRSSQFPVLYSLFIAYYTHTTLSNLIYVPSNFSTYSTHVYVYA
jgi:threonine dehydratase